MLYVPDGHLGKTGPLLLMLFALTGVPALAAAYVLLVWYLSAFGVFHFLFTIGFGFGVGRGISWCFRWGRVRHVSAAYWLAFAVGLLAWYVQWGLYASFPTDASDKLFKAGSTNIPALQAGWFGRAVEFITHPGLIGAKMAVLYQNGSWKLYGYTLSGWLLGVCWLLEWLLLVVATTIRGGMQADEPFSTTANAWMRPTKLPRQFQIDTPLDTLVAGWKKGHLDTLLAQPIATETDPLVGQLTLYTTPNDPTAYLAIDEITVAIDSEGRSETTRHYALRYVKLTAQQREQIQVTFG
jgi:hypothetical protein